MGYSSAGEARQAREALGKALEALQQDEDVPKEVLGIIQNVAKSVGALFDQDVKSEHSGVQGATESIADVVGILFPLTNKPSVRPDAASQRSPSQRSPASAPPAQRSASQRSPASAPPAQRSPSQRPASQRSPASAPPAQRSASQRSPASAPPASAPLASAPPASAPPASAPPASAPPASATPASAPPASATPSVAPAASATPSVAPAAQRPLSPSNRPSTRPLSSRPVSGAPARRPVEANLGATTQSNFYVGFSGEIAHGGVFLATYEALPKDTSVRMLVTLPGGFELECDGYVRFVRDPMDFMSESEPGMGIQFEGLSDEARDLVLRFIRKRPPIFYDV